MALLKKIPGQGFNSLDQIIAMDPEKAKQLSVSQIEITAADPEDLIYTYAALNHSAITQVENELVKAKVEGCFDTIQDFLKAKGLKDSLYNPKTDKDDSKKNAEELLKKLVENTEWAKSASEALGFNNMLVKGAFNEMTGMDWQQTVKQLSSFNDLSRENRYLQQIINAIALTTADTYMLKKAVSEKIGDEREFSLVLEQETAEFVKTTEYLTRPQSYNNGEMFKILRSIVSAKTYDPAHDFEGDIEKIEKKGSLDLFLSSFDVDATAKMLVNEHVLQASSKAQLVDMYAQLSAHKITSMLNKETKAASEEYKRIMKEFLGGKKALHDDKAAEGLLDELLKAYIKKKWEACECTSKVEKALELYKQKPLDFANILLQSFIFRRGYNKREIVKQLSKSNNLLEDEGVERIFEAFARDAVKAYMNRKQIEEYLVQEAQGIREPRDKEVLEAGNKFAKAKGYKIKEDAEVGTVLGIVNRTMLMQTYDVGEEFGKLYKESKIVDANGQPYTI